MSRTTLAVEIVGLHKQYDDGTDALRGIDLRVPAGGVFALLGRNGSGKTTTVRIMVGLTSSTSGTVTVLGHDVASQRERVQARIGVTLQEAALDEVLTGREFLRFVADSVATRDPDRGIVIVATGSYLGEGFDWPELDTLFLAFPLAFKGRVVQYVGRLLRSHEAKYHVELHDYVDGRIPVLDRMHTKRLPAYATLGFDVPTDRPGPRAGPSAPTLAEVDDAF